MYDELVKRLRETSCGAKDTLWWQAADAIEELQQIAGHYEESAHDYFKDVCYYLERVPKWIPVTERLPEKGRYLVVCKTIISGEQIARILRFSENLESVDKYDFEGEHRSGWYYYDDEYGHIEVDDVTHWMPLPTPPKE